MTEPILEASEVRFEYAGREALAGVSLAVRPGEFRIVLGPNGAGKSTLLRILAGLLVPSAGRVSLGGTDLARIARREVARRVAWVPQSLDAELPFTVREFATLSRYPHHPPLAGPTAADREAVDRALHALGVDAFAGRELRALSGGERQKALLAAALAQAAPILLADEPSASLDPRHALEIYDVLDRLRREEGRTIVVVTHDLVLAASYAERILLLSGGKAAAEGPAGEVLREDVLERVYGVPFRRVEERVLLPGRRP